MGGEGVDRLALEFLVRLRDPDGGVVGAQVVIAVGLVVEQTHKGDRAVVLGELNGTPGGAPVDGGLVARPDGGLLDGKVEPEFRGLCLEFLNGDVVGFDHVRSCVSFVLRRSSHCF